MDRRRATLTVRRSLPRAAAYAVDMAWLFCSLCRLGRSLIGCIVGLRRSLPGSGLRGLRLCLLRRLGLLLGRLLRCLGSLRLCGLRRLGLLLCGLIRSLGSLCLCSLRRLGLLLGGFLRCLGSLCLCSLRRLGLLLGRLLRSLGSRLIRSLRCVRLLLCSLGRIGIGRCSRSEERRV